MEIIFHKCEFVGEIASVQLVERSLCLENYDRIEKTLRHCMDVNMLPENLNTRRVAVLMRSYISGIMENWLFAPESFDLKNEARQYVAVLLEMCLFVPTLAPAGRRDKLVCHSAPGILRSFCLLLFCRSAAVIFLPLDYFRSLSRFRNIHSHDYVAAL